MKVIGNKLLFAKVRDNAIIPTKRVEDAGYDLYCCCDEDVVIKPHETKLIPTGVACAMSEDYCLYLVERGSTGSKGMKKSCGVIDSGFRNEIFAAIYNGNDYDVVITDKVNKTELGYVTVKEPNVTYAELDNMPLINSHPSEYQIPVLYYPKSKAICQGLVLPVPKMYVKEVTYDDLKKYTSERGEGMLGASGK